jgi:hypothetical protein
MPSLSKLKLAEEGCALPAAERLRGLEVDHQFVPGRRLNRKVGWLFALEDAVDVAGGAPELVDEIGP